MANDAKISIELWSMDTDNAEKMEKPEADDGTEMRITDFSALFSII